MTSPLAATLAAALLLLRARGTKGDAVCTAPGSPGASAGEPSPSSLIQQVSVRSPGRSPGGGRAAAGRGLHAQALAGPAPAPPPVELLGMASAPKPHLVKQAVAKAKKIKEASENGDLHYTQHGCHCLLEWTYEGRPQKGCSKESPDFAHGHHWCRVSAEDCPRAQGVLPSGEKWDFCFLDDEVVHEMTVHGCHCAPHWEWNETVYDGCSRTSQGPMWCYVFESGSMCPDSLRTEHHGQHWDYCFVQEQTSPYLTRAGCHCSPKWTWEGKEYEGCAKIDEKMFCQVLEDATDCQMGQQLPMQHHTIIVDQCSVLAGAEDAIVPNMTTAGRSSCHCQPRWTHDGEEYQGCAKTPDGEKRWCYLLEDERMCDEADGTGGGKEAGQRWRYCGEDQESRSRPSRGATTQQHMHYHYHVRQPAQAAEEVDGPTGTPPEKRDPPKSSAAALHTGAVLTIAALALVLT